MRGYLARAQAGGRGERELLAAPAVYERRGVWTIPAPDHVAARHVGIARIYVVPYAHRVGDGRDMHDAHAGLGVVDDEPRPAAIDREILRAMPPDQHAGPPLRPFE